jgi:hypothetical protein
MVKRNKNKVRNGKGRNGSKKVVFETLSQGWDQALANRRDRCRVVDRFYGGIILSSTVASQVLSVTSNSSGTLIPGNFGTRVFSIGIAFLRWKINRLLVRVIPTTAPTAPTVYTGALGFIDDPEQTLSPTAVDAISDLRVSRILQGVTFDELEWRPIDPGKWYYVQVSAGGGVAEGRQDYPVALIGQLSGGQASVQVFYDLSFDGAANVAANNS